MRAGFLATLMVLSLAPASVALPEAALAAGQKAPAAPKARGPEALQSSVQWLAGRISVESIPSEVLVPIAQCPAEMAAPSAADWLTSPAQIAVTGEGFAAWKQASLEPNPAFVRAGGQGASVKTATSTQKEPSAQKGPSAQKEPSVQKVSAAHDEPVRVPLPPQRPAVPVTLAMLDTTSDAVDEPAAQPARTTRRDARRRMSPDQAPPEIEALMARHAERYNVPVTLVRRVAWRESKFDPSQRNGPYWGLMQIRVDTARGLGFRGKPTDLLDADTNMTYAVAYLANAYRVSGHNEKRAVALYAGGYYYAAKRKGMLGALIKTASAED